MDSQTMGMIGLAVLFLASVVIAFFSAKSWHWGHVVIVLFLFLSGMGASILTAEVVKIRRVYELRVSKLETDIKTIAVENNALEFGSFDDQLIEKLSGEQIKLADEGLIGNVSLASRLNTITRLRGLVWRGMQPAGQPDPQTGDVALTFPPAVEGGNPRGEQGLRADGIVFVFEEGRFDPQKPMQFQYLGEFQVTQSGAGGVTISPMLIHSWSNNQRDRLAGSQTTWSLYEKMPTDRHDLFAFSGLSPEERAVRLRTILPKDSADDYIRDGQAATNDDDPKIVFPYSLDGRPLTKKEASDADPGEVEKRYVRPLRAYGYLFSELAGARIVMLSQLDAVGKDTQRLIDSKNNAEKDLSVRKQEYADTTHDRDGFRRDKEVAEAYLATVQSLRGRAAAMLTTTLAENSRLASELAATHLRIIESLQ